MEKYLQDLLDRMADRSDDMIYLPGGGRQSNPNAIFIKARDEAKQISNIEYVDQLRVLIEKSKNEDLKKNTYEMLFNIYSNTDEFPCGLCK